MQSTQPPTAVNSQHSRPAIKAVLFDLDDTLFDFQYCHRQGLEAARSQHPLLLQQTLDDIVKEYGRHIDDVWPKVLRGEISVEQSRIERFRRVLTLYGIETTEDSIKLERHYWDTYQTHRRQVPGAAALLQALKSRVTVGIVTNNLLLTQQEKLRWCGLEHLIDFMVVSEEVRSIKPDPVIFQVALEKAGCMAQEAVMVGDSWGADIIGARALGMRTVWLNRTGAAFPKPALKGEVIEITALEPVDEVVRLILGA